MSERAGTGLVATVIRPTLSAAALAFGTILAGVVWIRLLDYAENALPFLSGVGGSLGAFTLGLLLAPIGIGAAVVYAYKRTIAGLVLSVVFCATCFWHIRGPYIEPDAWVRMWLAGSLIAGLTLGWIGVLLGWGARLTKKELRR
ncbi:hypothetical protein ACLI4Z_13835 [Natrialbaceae archaeon A-arb3/5]